ncbi:hypothetical protein [Kocuria rhizosphaericola]|uniref:hypothetical protein n=1 Tax=Kocuria rhizosphaericola TaxID=3376284 RepID=UPI003792A3C2
MGLIAEYTVILTICVAVGVISAGLFAIRSRRLFNFRSLVLINYTAVLPISGLAHLLGGRLADTGHYDIRATPEALAAAVWGTVIGLVSLLVGLSLQSRRYSKKIVKNMPLSRLTPGEKRVLLAVVAILVPLGLFASMQMQRYANSTGQTRIIEADGLYVAYTYLSHWLVWGISLGAILVINLRWGKNRAVVVVALLVAVLGITSALAWSGGRSIVPTMALPVIMILFSRLRGERMLLGLLGMVGASIYIGNQTSRRLGPSAGFDIVAWLDWQWGRFSMLGWAHNEASEGGWLLGETLAASYSQFLASIFRLVGITLELPEWRSVLELTSETILRDRDAVYVVPGLMAELALNFGTIGIVAGMLLIGIAVGWVDGAYVRSSSYTTRLLVAYLGSLLIFRTFTAESAAFPAYVLYSGLPLVAVAVASAYLRKRSWNSNFVRGKWKIQDSSFSV